MKEKDKRCFKHQGALQFVVNKCGDCKKMARFSAKYVRGHGKVV